MGEYVTSKQAIFNEALLFEIVCHVHAMQVLQSIGISC